jgi:hypothetical protein
MRLSKMKITELPGKPISVPQTVPVSAPISGNILPDKRLQDGLFLPIARADLARSG